MNFEIADKSTEIQANWYEAKMYCFSLGNGWRLPTKDELFEIFFHSEHDFEKDWHWSSTELDDRFAWYQGMGYGTQYVQRKDYGNHYFVRAVRDLKDN